MTGCLVLAGCAGTATDADFASVHRLGRERLNAEVKWLASDEARRQARADVDAMLAQPLSGDNAVRIALAYSPALQSLLFEGSANFAAGLPSARLPNPVLAFEHLARNATGVRELEITRTLSFSLLDLLLWPERNRQAAFAQERVRLKVAGDVVQAATGAREAWVRAVAAQQALQYIEHVKEAADAGAELARRMQAAGNFSPLQHAREQAFSAEAALQLVRAKQAAQSSRETLTRALGLDDGQARALKLPERLPDLPASLQDEQASTQAGLDQRLDVAWAKATLEFTARDQGLTRVTSMVNGLSIGAEQKNETGAAPKRGYTLELPLPIFDFGGAARSQAEATYMAALHRAAQIGVEASSRLREAAGAYQAAFDAARRYRDEIVPLRKRISDENLRRYNGMQIGVFELLADAREQAATVAQAIDAQRDFWLADAALQAELIGKPAAHGF